MFELSIPTQFGILNLKAHHQALYEAKWCSRLQDHSSNTTSPILLKAALQISEYEQGKRTHFDLPLDPQGTLFQRKVWNALLKIPFGQTLSYSDLAIAVNAPKASRAVGLANSQNPLLFFIPCHRVIQKNGHLGGYAGGRGLKQQLLSFEKALFKV